MLKKLIVLLVSLVIGFSTLIFASCASLGLEYEKMITSERKIEYSVVGVKSWFNSSELTIPKKYLGSPVTRISTLGVLPNLQSVKIPDSITYIANGAFNDTGCYINPTNWVNNAFYAGGYLIEANAVNENIFILESNTIGIANNAFTQNSAIQEVVMNDGLKTVCNQAFEDCLSLKRITLGKSVEYIGEQAFVNCQNLQEILITNTVSFLGEQVFAGCLSLGKVVIDANLAKLNSGTFSGCANLSSVIFTGEIKEIENRAFAFCSSLVNISLPNGIEVIGAGAFSNCDSLKQVIMPNTLKKLGNKVFYDLNAEIFFKGSQEEWEKIENSRSIENAVYFFSSTEPQQEGKYWQFSENGESPIKWS